MEATKSPDWNVVGILGASRGARTGAGGPIGSEHLLAGITAAKGAAREALAAEGATKVALLAVLRDRTDRDDAWSADDDAEGVVTERDVLGEEGEDRTRYTGAAARALTAAMEQARREDAKKFGAEHLLRGLLEGDNRAVEALGTCGIPPQAVLARLDGGTGSQEDSLDPLLHPTRDVLLGHRHYRRAPLWMRWLLKLSGVNWAARPAWWVRMETYEQARRLGSDTVGTEHVLLAVLATHEVAQRYPHLAGESTTGLGSRYAGGERLADLGVDYASVHSALTAGDRVRLTPDARPVEQYIDETKGAGPTSVPDPGRPDSRSDAEPPADPGTGPLVETLLGEETRARRLVEALAAPPGN
ncbi:Clp protease N-terminal domain-containing protein [Streptomyces sp. NPDC041068]|uniref:Clp protease N-terminal domain-containing protein n=1 Tax=Streptomyces sp. NPDC041068 TaxID=3155130 RepID=UPI003405DC88